MSHDLPRTAEVVIVGGGVVGAAIAWYLTEAGCHDVVILERECVPGLGSTGRATGGLRAQFDDLLEMRCSLYSIDFFRRFRDATGVDPDYHPTGYLFVATDDARWADLQARTERLRGAGLEQVRLCTPDEAGAMVPALRTDDVLGASFCDIDGFIDPLAVLRGFTRGACARGARVCTDTNVQDIAVTLGQVSGVITNRGRIATAQVVNAAGAWGGAVARMAGVQIPVQPLRRQVAGTPPLPALADDTPMVADYGTGFHFRKDRQGNGGALLLWGDPAETYGEGLEVDRAWIGEVWARALHRLPCVADVGLLASRCWAGLYAVTPDQRPVLGPVPGVAGLYLANGFSGHGVMHAPATGRLLAEWMLTGAPRLFDAAAFSVERFHGDPVSDPAPPL